MYTTLFVANVEWQYLAVVYIWKALYIVHQCFSQRVLSAYTLCVETDRTNTKTWKRIVEQQKSAHCMWRRGIEGAWRRLLGRQRDKEKRRGNSAGVELERIVLSPGLHISDGVFSEFWTLSLFVTNFIYPTLSIFRMRRCNTRKLGNKGFQNP